MEVAENDIVDVLGHHICKQPTQISVGWMEVCLRRRGDIGLEDTMLQCSQGLIMIVVFSCSMNDCAYV